MIFIAIATVCISVISPDFCIAFTIIILIIIITIRIMTVIILKIIEKESVNTKGVEPLEKKKNRNISNYIYFLR